MPEPGGSVRSLVIPLQRDALLLPSALVAEVISYNQLEPIDDGPAWVLGTTKWREQDIPVVSMELVFGRVVPDYRGVRARIIVMYTLGRRPEMPFYGIVAQGIPGVYRADPESVRLLDGEVGDQPYVAASVELGESGQAIIPDLKVLQEELLTTWV